MNCPARASHSETLALILLLRANRNISPFPNYLHGGDYCLEGTMPSSCLDLASLAAAVRLERRPP